MESFLYAFFISDSETPASNPSMLNGSNIWICKVQMYIRFNIDMLYAQRTKTRSTKYI